MRLFDEVGPAGRRIIAVNHAKGRWVVITEPVGMRGAPMRTRAATWHTSTIDGPKPRVGEGGRR